MTVDLTKLSIDTTYNAFKNNAGYSGTFNITGSTAAGANIQTFTATLSSIPDMTDVVFNGPTAFGTGSDPRPAGGWFKQGQVWVRGDNAGAGYTNYPTNWEMFSYINGTTLTILAVYAQSFTPSLTLTSTSFSYRLVDYSVF